MADTSSIKGVKRNAGIFGSGSPLTKGAVAGLLSYVTMPGQFFTIGGANAPLAHAMIAGGSYYFLLKMGYLQ